MKNQDSQSENTGRKISRRQFIKTAAAGAAGIASMGILGGCNSSANPADSSTATSTVGSSIEPSTKGGAAVVPEETLETDVVVVGTGVAGIIAACGAADMGANVIAIDRATGFLGTNLVNCSGAWCVDSTPQKAAKNPMTQEEAFNRIMEGTHYQCNAKVVRSMLKKSGRAVDILIDGGIQFMYPFELTDDPEDWLSRGGHVYLQEASERAETLQGIMDSRDNITCLWEAEVTSLVSEEGIVTGVLLQGQNGKVTQINAPSVVICTGGFLANPDMVAQYYSGAKLISQGSKNNDGAGIKLAQSAGAQIGKNFSLSINEMGAANEKAVPAYSWAPGRGTNSGFYLPMFGNILLDNDGNRFMNEQRMCEKTMYSGEPIIRESTYYTIADQTFMDRLASTPVMDFLSESAIANMAPALVAGFDGVVLSNIFDDFETAVTEGWAYKANSLEEIAEFFDLPDLVATIGTYNTSCESGVDEYMFTPAEYLNPVKEGPFYIYEYNVGAWLTLGGIKCDGSCRAVNADNKTIPGLFVAGADADLWSTPYYQGGSAQGFCLASGMVAGEAAAENAGKGNG